MKKRSETKARVPQPIVPSLAWPAEGLDPLPFTALTLFVIGALYTMAFQPMWANDLATDVTEYSLRASRFLDGTLHGSEYPPVAVYWFLIVHYLEHWAGISYHNIMMFFNAALIAMHLAFFNQISGRRAVYIFAALIFCAGPIVLYRFELFASMWVLTSWYAWRRGWPRLAGFLLSLAILTKLYPLLLIPFLLRSPEGRWQWRPVLGTLGLALTAIMMIFTVQSGGVDILADVFKFHEHKPVGVESTAAAVASLFYRLRGVWPPPYANTYGIHGLELSGAYRMLWTAGLLATIALLFTPLNHAASEDTPPSDDAKNRPEPWDESIRFILTAQALFIAINFWSTLFQPQYLLWPAVFTALLPLNRGDQSRVDSFVMLYCVALLAEQVIYPCHYSRFLSVFQNTGREVSLMLTLAANKICVTSIFVLALVDAARPSYRTKAREV